MRIAMWSGPRNLSTAMMYSFAQRADMTVMDEPFYAAYLAATHDDHPLAEEVVAAGECDPIAVARICATAGEDGQHSYQKHMCHHMIDGFPRNWMTEVVNVFLIRHPARVLASYHVKRQNPSLFDIGFAEQIAMFHDLRATGKHPVVIDSATVRAAPEPALRALCDAIGLPFDPAMLHWPKGGNPADGIWAKHWYGAVWNSTGFAGAEGPLPKVDPAHRAVFEPAMAIYEELSQHRLTV